MPTKEEKIILLRHQINLYKHSLTDHDSFDNILLRSNNPKKDRLRMWGESLEKLFFLEGRVDEIDSISTIITLELKEMNLNSAVSYVRKALPDKYKDHSQIRAPKLLEIEDITYCENDSRQHTKEQYTNENLPEITRSRRDISLLEKYISKLENNHMLSKVDMAQYNEFCTRRDGLAKMVEEAFDARNDVLPTKLHVLIHAFTQSTKGYAFAKYMEHMRGLISLTPKQATKLATGLARKTSLLYEPKSQSEATTAGFIGMPCEECGSYRVDLKYNPDRDIHAGNMHWCYSCRTWTERSIEELMKREGI